MISEEQLNVYRISGCRVKVVRDGNADNDIIGVVVAWDDESVLLRKLNRKVIKLSRTYSYEPANELKM